MDWKYPCVKIYIYTQFNNAALEQMLEGNSAGHLLLLQGGNVGHDSAGLLELL